MVSITAFPQNKLLPLLQDYLHESPLQTKLIPPHRKKSQGIADGSHSSLIVIIPAPSRVFLTTNIMASRPVRIVNASFSRLYVDGVCFTAIIALAVTPSFSYVVACLMSTSRTSSGYLQIVQQKPMTYTSFSMHYRIGVGAGG